MSRIILLAVVVSLPLMIAIVALGVALVRKTQRIEATLKKFEEGALLEPLNARLLRLFSDQGSRLIYLECEIRLLREDVSTDDSAARFERIDAQ